ncbi:hypothetical protein Cs7R123_59720 [Catellatospora sp. TT07R-123]|nr:hypothetical protein Cs7R123_59720 [Catellatospora sp. TT07R-123]
MVAVVALVAATAAGLVHRRRAGTVRRVSNDDGQTALLRDLGVPGGTVTLLQFSSAFCAPCRATRVICAHVAETVPGVAHVEIDAESRLEAVRALDIWRTPTVLVVDRAGRIAGRAQGTPTRAQVLAAVAPLLAAVAPTSADTSAADTSADTEKSPA